MRASGTPWPSQRSIASWSTGTCSSPAKTVIQMRSGSMPQPPVESSQANATAPSLK